MKPECAAGECHNPAATKGMCSAHYQRQRRYGDPTAGRTPNGTGRKPKAKRKAVKMPKGWDRKTEKPKPVRPAIEDIHIDKPRALTPEEIALTLRLLTRHGRLELADALGIAS
ncbi:MAG: hypothetical protein M0Z51_07530 [Propionibacterium sp.]|nr:hypothetical protein [Propionibacterium sp.]